jgi:hypothetical protein
MTNYNPNPKSPNYMSSDWGNSNTKMTAFHIDAISDKAKFAIEMLESALKGFDTIEKEIVDASNATNPISREGLRAFAYRVDTHQNQVADGLKRLKQMMDDIDKSTDQIQNQRTSW